MPVDGVPAERLRALALAAKNGKLREDGPVCARPPTAEEAVGAAYPKLLRAELDASCRRGDPCSASLRVTDGSHLRHSFTEGDTLAEAFVSPEDPLEVVSWEAAFSKVTLKAPDPNSAGTIGFGSLVTGGPQIVIDGIDARGSFSPAPLVGDFEAEGKSLTRSCGKTDWFTEEVLVEVADSGKITRCEAEVHASETPASCLCSTLSAHRFAPGAGKRRARISLGKRGGLGGGVGVGGSGSSSGKGLAGLARGSSTRKDVDVFEQGGTFDEPVEVGRERGGAMASCFAAAGPEATFELRSALGAAGKVTAVRVSKRAEMTDEEVQCVGKAAARFVYRCPDHLGDEVWGKYKVRRSTKP